MTISMLNKYKHIKSHVKQKYGNDDTNVIQKNDIYTTNNEREK